MRKVLLCLLAGFLRITVQGGESFTENDLERILVTRTAPMKFWVFRGYTDDNALKCVPLAGAGKSVGIPPDTVEKTDFFNTSSEFDFLHAVICMLPFRTANARRWKIVSCLARQTGAMPPVISLLEQHNRKLEQLLAMLQRNRTSGARDGRDMPEDRSLEDISRLCSDLHAALEDQLKQGQFLLAVAMHMAFRRIQMNRNIRENISAGSFFNDWNRDAEKLLIAHAARLYQDQPYKDEYCRLFPRTRGLWSASPPHTWKELVQVWMQSMQSYYDLNKYSAAADFEAWGCCMLNVLLFARDMPQAKTLIRQYRGALAEYRKIFKP